MANVHGISDFATAPGRGGATGLLGGFGRTTNDAGGTGGDDSGELKYLTFLFPGWRWRSMIVAFSVLEIAVYTWTCVAEGSRTAPLDPSMESLSMFGNGGVYVRNGQLWRLVTPIFLHADIWHILFNVYFQLVMGFSVESTYGPLLFSLLYMFTGIFGNLFSASTTFCTFPKIGASTAGFGLIGAQLCGLLLMWNFIANKPNQVFRLAVFFISLLMMSAMYKNLDQLGHLGGFIAGMALCVLFNQNMENKPRWYAAAKWSSLIGMPLLIALCSLLIWVVPRSC